MKRFLVLTVFIVLSGSIHTYGLETPTDAVKDMVDEVIGILENEELKGSSRTEARRSLLEVAIGRRLHYEEMAKRTLAIHWRDRTPTEQKEFVELFHAFLSKTYAKRLERYSQEQVQYGKVRMKDSYAEVQTIVASAKTTIDLDYRLMLRHRHWWIYDIVVNGVSLVKKLPRSIFPDYQFFLVCGFGRQIAGPVRTNRKSLTHVPPEKTSFKNR